MKISGEYTFDGPQDVVWDTFMDTTVLAGVLPGCESLDEIGQDEYEGALKIKVGPVQGTFLGKVKLEDIAKPDSYTMTVDGRGKPGFVRATGHLALEPIEDKTRVRYEGDAHIGGRLASVGQRLMDSSTKAIIKQSLDGLNAAVVARVAAREGNGEGGEATAPAISAPSQAEFAANVAREVAKDLAPTAGRYAAIGVVVILALVLLYVVLT